MSARSTISVLALGMSRPASTIVVQTSTSASPRTNFIITSSSWLLPHLAVRDQHLRVRAHRAHALGGLVDRVDAVVQEEGLALARALALDRLLDQLLVVLADVGA